MARILTTPASSGAAASSTGLLDRYTPKFPVGSVTVPPGAAACFITGVAAGGRAVTMAGANMLNPVLLASSASGNIIVSNGVDTGNSSAVLYDPVGRKQVPLLGPGGPPIQNNAGGQQLAVLDNGFILSGGTISMQLSIDFGNNWLSYTYIKNGQRSLAVAPASIDDPIMNVRAAYITNGVATANSVGVWTGVSLYEGLVSYSASTTLTQMDYVNEFFILSATGGTNKTCLYYKEKAGANNPNNWPVSVVDAVNNKTPAGIAFGAGLYVYACSDGSLYTATTLAGPWTARTSNITSIHGIKFAGGRFVCVGAGVSSQSTDGITWVNGAQTGLTWTNPAKVVYCTKSSKWVACAGASNIVIYTSANGSTWVANTNPNMPAANLLADTPCGLFFISTSSGYVSSEPVAGSALSLSTSNDGGALRVTRVADDSEQLMLAGGLSNGIGGSSISQPGIDSYGSNGVQTGTASGVEARPPALPQLGTVATYGLKVSGGAGRANTSQGGASLFAPPTNFLLATSAAATKPVGPGAGGANSTVASMGAGGGEGVIRHKISVTPGEVLAFSSGLAISNSNLSSAASLAFEPSRGYISFEFA
ncbi:MAG: hypothetical protein NT086_11265 [Proteobacteria bacterium]|nr:hypothetical protein [Pseudomonadota bacterium]